MHVLNTLYDIAKQQRLLWISAVLVALTLVLIAHAPVLPVVGGCVFAFIMVALKSWPGSGKRPWQRGDE